MHVVDAGSTNHTWVTLPGRGPVRLDRRAVHDRARDQRRPRGRAQLPVRGSLMPEVPQAPVIDGLELLDVIGDGGSRPSGEPVRCARRERRGEGPEGCRARRRSPSLVRGGEPHDGAGCRPPGIANIFASNATADGRPFLVLQYYPRGHYGDRVAERPLDQAEALRVGACRSPARSRPRTRAGIVHRDIKPENVLVDTYGPVLTDFGVSTFAAEPTLRSRTCSRSPTRPRSSCEPRRRPPSPPTSTPWAPRSGRCCAAGLPTGGSSRHRAGGTGPADPQRRCAHVAPTRCRSDVRRGAQAGARSRRHQPAGFGTGVRTRPAVGRAAARLAPTPLELAEAEPAVVPPRPPVGASPEDPGQVTRAHSILTRKRPGSSPASRRSDMRSSRHRLRSRCPSPRHRGCLSHPVHLVRPTGPGRPPPGRRRPLWLVGAGAGLLLTAVAGAGAFAVVDGGGATPTTRTTVAPVEVPPELGGVRVVATPTAVVLTWGVDASEPDQRVRIGRSRGGPLEDVQSVPATSGRAEVPGGPGLLRAHRARRRRDARPGRAEVHALSRRLTSPAIRPTLRRAQPSLDPRPQQRPPRSPVEPRPALPWSPPTR